MYSSYTTKFGQLFYVIKHDDGSETHFTNESPYYQAYLKWLEAGNTPLPADTGA